MKKVLRNYNQRRHKLKSCQILKKSLFFRETGGLKKVMKYNFFLMNEFQVIFLIIIEDKYHKKYL